MGSLGIESRSFQLGSTEDPGELLQTGGWGCSVLGWAWLEGMASARNLSFKELMKGYFCDENLTYKLLRVK